MHLLVIGALVAATQDTARWTPVARYLEESVARGAFPGAVVAIGRADTVLYLRAVGRHDFAGGPAMTPSTVFDIASLTKVVGLTTALMMLVEQSRLDLDTPARGYVQMFGYQHDAAITLRSLLTHSSGLPAWRPFWQAVGRTGGQAVGRSDGQAVREGAIDALRQAMHDLVNAEPIEQPTGSRMVYSDLGAMVLTQAAEVVSGERIDRFLQRMLFDPLGMRSTRYRPPRSWLPRIAPTEVDTTWRHRLVRGQVHDENAASMGGISGHAGIFSTAVDLARFAQMMLRGGTYPGSRARSETLVTGAHAPGFAGAASERDVDIRFVQESTLVRWTRVQQPGFSTRALGWDTPDGQNSAGTRMTNRAFGHTGFTGTSMWMDPGQNLFVILLTNRVHPTRENTLIFEVRRRVADLAVEIAGGS